MQCIILKLIWCLMTFQKSASHQLYEGCHRKRWLKKQTKRTSRMSVLPSASNILLGNYVRRTKCKAGAKIIYSYSNSMVNIVELRGKLIIKWALVTKYIRFDNWLRQTNTLALRAIQGVSINIVSTTLSPSFREMIKWRSQNRVASSNLPSILSVLPRLPLAFASPSASRCVLYKVQ